MYNDMYCHDKTNIKLNRRESLMGIIKKLAYELLPTSDKTVTAYDDILSK